MCFSLFPFELVNTSGTQDGSRFFVLVCFFLLKDEVVARLKEAALLH